VLLTVVPPGTIAILIAERLPHSQSLYSFEDALPHGQVTPDSMVAGGLQSEVFSHSRAREIIISIGDTRHDQRPKHCFCTLAFPISC